MSETKKLWKSLKYRGGKIVSNYDDSEWIPGEWRTVCVPTEECKGLNACENIIDAINYVIPEILAQVEVAGCCIKGDDKFTCERMRIIRAWKWEKEDSVALSTFAARLCLKNFEDVYPDDRRVRNTIELVEKYQTDPESVTVAELESAARSAESAGSAEKSSKQKMHKFLVKRFKHKQQVQP